LPVLRRAAACVFRLPEVSSARKSREAVRNNQTIGHQFAKDPQPGCAKVFVPSTLSVKNEAPRVAR